MVRPAVLTVSGVLMVRVFAPSTRTAKSLPAAEAMIEVPPLMVLLPPVRMMPAPAAAAPTPTVSVCPDARVRLFAPSILRELIEAVV